MGSCRIPYAFPFVAPSLVLHTPNGRFLLERDLFELIVDEFSPVFTIRTFIMTLLSWGMGQVQFPDDDKAALSTCLAYDEARVADDAKMSGTRNRHHPGWRFLPTLVASLYGLKAW